ncbi:copine [Tupanvirus soda lake]|uniref:Copine n=2 Tax=Tupanvirus TaxID=2094720 RepID=A0A6N1NSH5_9VIRU|nr:copine [Tupanvirus soda lake]QKU34696.1 copine [Tupanvirus soda lake]
MGNSKSKNKNKSKNNKKIETCDFSFIKDNYNSFAELEEALRQAGLEACQLIIGIDFTKSNSWQGGQPYFKYQNLHSITSDPNPYQQVLSIMCQSLAGFDNDNLIDAYGFGDARTCNKSVFSFYVRDESGYMIDVPCYRLEGVLERYKQIAMSIELSGPTSFAPIIYKAIDIVRSKNEYHILLIIADGAVDDMKQTINAIVEASNYPLSIVCVGVGKGPWDKMEEMDDNIPDRRFDNFQFVNFHKIMEQCENAQIEFAKHALMEIPIQYKYIRNYIL